MSEKTQWHIEQARHGVQLTVGSLTVIIPPYKAAEMLRTMRTQSETYVCVSAANGMYYDVEVLWPGQSVNCHPAATEPLLKLSDYNAESESLTEELFISERDVLKIRHECTLSCVAAGVAI